MNTVKDILDHKGKMFGRCASKDTLLTALNMMEAHKVGSLLIIEQGVIKVSSQSGILHWQIAKKGTCPLDQPVSIG